MLASNLGSVAGSAHWGCEKTYEGWRYRNKIETRHVSGTNYTDILVTCLLDYGEPSGQSAFDTADDIDNLYVFDELGLKSYSTSGTGRLLTHVIFHPVQKSLNRLIQIDYTVRVQSLSGI